MWLKVRHFIASKIGTVSAQTCIDNGCSKFHGTSPSQAMLFVFGKNPTSFHIEPAIVSKALLERREALKGRL